MITVACVLKSGGIYTPEWVEKLKGGVERHLSLPHRFVCLSDIDVPCERIPLITDWRGWWSKLELFREGLLEGPTFYADLDTVVVGSLNRVASHPHTFTMAHEYYRPERLCSTAMAWTGDHSFLFDAFAEDPKGIAKQYDEVFPSKDGRIGDQSFIEDQFKLYGIRPDTFRDLFGERTIASYKVHGCQEAPPSDAVVVAMHGRPKPDEITKGWVADAWK